jgi:MYXO-CTERM domain-containing protein
MLESPAGDYVFEVELASEGPPQQPLDVDANASCCTHVECCTCVDSEPLVLGEVRIIGEDLQATCEAHFGAPGYYMQGKGCGYHDPVWQRVCKRPGCTVATTPAGGGIATLLALAMAVMIFRSRKRR